MTAEPLEMLEVAGERILVIDRWRFLGRDGIEIADELANSFTFRDGLISRIEGFTDRPEALAALGLGG